MKNMRKLGTMLGTNYVFNQHFFFTVSEINITYFFTVYIY